MTRKNVVMRLVAFGIAASLILTFAIAVRGSAAQHNGPNGNYYSLPSAALKLEVPEAASFRNAFEGRTSAANALLYKFAFALIPKVEIDKAPESVSIRFIRFRVSKLQNLGPQDFADIRLVEDENANGELDPDETKVVGYGRFVMGEADRWTQYWYLVFEFPEPLEIRIGSLRAFLLVADFPRLRNAGLTIDLEYISGTEVLKINVPGGKNVGLEGSGPYVTHLVRNWVPELSYGFEEDARKRKGVGRQSIVSGESQLFSVIYSDEEQTRATVHQVWVDLDGDGLYSQEEKFELGFAEPGEPVGHHDEFAKTIRIRPKKAGRISYRFFFKDGQDEAVGEPTEDHYFVVEPAISVVGLGYPKEVLPGEVIIISAVIAYFDRDAGIAKTDWRKILAKLPLEPLQILGIELGGKQKAQDDTRFTLLLVHISARVSSEARPDESIAAARSALGVVRKIDGEEEVEEQFDVPEMTFRVVPFRIQAGPNRVSGSIGDEIVYEIRVEETRHAAVLGVAGTAGQPTALELLTFKPFKIRDVRVIRRNIGGITETRYLYYLTIYEAPSDEPYFFPAFEMRYKRQDRKNEEVFAVSKAPFLLLPIAPPDLAGIEPPPQSPEQVMGARDIPQPASWVLWISALVGILGIARFAVPGIRRWQLSRRIVPVAPPEFPVLEEMRALERSLDRKRLDGFLKTLRRYLEAGLGFQALGSTLSETLIERSSGKLRELALSLQELEDVFYHDEKPEAERVVPILRKIQENLPKP